MLFDHSGVMDVATVALRCRLVDFADLRFRPPTGLPVRGQLQMPSRASSQVSGRGEALLDSQVWCLCHGRSVTYVEDLSCLLLKDTLYERFGLHSQNQYNQCETFAY
jgi:hypothetical protein